MAYSFEGRRMSTLLCLVILLVGIGVHTVAVGGGKVTAHSHTPIPLSLQTLQIKNQMYNLCCM